MVNGKSEQNISPLKSYFLTFRTVFLIMELYLYFVCDAHEDLDAGEWYLTPWYVTWLPVVFVARQQFRRTRCL